MGTANRTHCPAHLGPPATVAVLKGMLKFVGPTSGVSVNRLKREPFVIVGSRIVLAVRELRDSVAGSDRLRRHGGASGAAGFSQLTEPIVRVSASSVSPFSTMTGADRAGAWRNPKVDVYSSSIRSRRETWRRSEQPEVGQNEAAEALLG